MMEEHNEHKNKNDGTLPDSDKPATGQPAQGEPDADLTPWLLLIMLLTLMLVVLTPLAWRAIRAYGLPDVTRPLGTVQRITFLGGWGTTTQVDTQTHSVLLRGAVNLTLGTELEQRKKFWGFEVCEVHSERCESMVSDD